jgi:hypothetical protein
MTVSRYWSRLALPLATGHRVMRPRTLPDEIAAVLSNRPLQVGHDYPPTPPAVSGQATASIRRALQPSST